MLFHKKNPGLSSWKRKTLIIKFGSLLKIMCILKTKKSMVKFKNGFFIFLCLCTVYVEAQSIEVISFNNPLEVSSLLGGELSVDIKYTSESGATSNNFYIGLQELDENNQFVRTIDGVDFVNQTTGTDLSLSANLFVGTIHPLSNELEAGHYYQITAKLYTNNWNALASADYTNTPLLTTQNTNPYNLHLSNCKGETLVR